MTFTVFVVVRVVFPFERGREDFDFEAEGLARRRDFFVRRFLLPFGLLAIVTLSRRHVSIARSELGTNSLRSR